MPQDSLNWDVIILGAGGAGMMCAIEAGKRGRRVVVLDHAKKVGAKILISGGGRCNFTNTDTRAEAFVSQNPHFCKSALSRFTPNDFIALVKAHGIAFHEKKLGQLFCDVTAREIVTLLVTECERAGAAIHLDTLISKIAKMRKDDGRFFVETNRGTYTAPAVVVATGGFSIPTVGATGLGYEIAKQFGLRVVSPAPALDGFVMNPDFLRDFHGLPGVSADTIVTCNGVAFRENILFTHMGLSGPAALQASLYWNPGDTITINLLPGKNATEWLLRNKEESGRSEVKNLLAALLTKSLAERLCALYLKNELPIARISDETLRRFGQKLQSWALTPKATVGYNKAEVTRGGISTDELFSKTMESKKVPGLYFIGEVVDVTGWLGGYNFQWAWASGWAAGQSV